MAKKGNFFHILDVQPAIEIIYITEHVGYFEAGICATQLYSYNKNNTMYFEIFYMKFINSC